MKKIALFIVLFCCIFYFGCSEERKPRLPKPVLYYVPSDDTLNCEQLKAEMAKIKRDISLIVPLAKAWENNPENKTESRSRRAEKIEILALNARYSNLLMLAYKYDDCTVNGLSLDNLHKRGEGEFPLLCTYCGPRVSKEWHIIDGQLVCDNCFKKGKASKQKIK